MESAIQVIGSFLAAALGWVVLEFVGRPLRRFYDLRGEVIRRLTEFANVGARLREIPDDSGAASGRFEVLNLSAEEVSRLENAQAVLRDLASQLTAFAYNETAALYLVKATRYDPLNAASGLIGLANRIGSRGPNVGQERMSHRKRVVEGLRLRDDVMSP
jgi:hypothetical protein